MPKVSRAYFEHKREYIIQCAMKIFAEKPLADISLHEIIKETGFSQGAIYRYYKSALEIYIDAANRLTSERKQEKDTLLSICQSSISE
ncbi:MAG TPA: TetR/AcrR family transcriptional regulator [Candidatus Eubacterium faecipullorum]|uniref:TetR/AcrR family transcriptional regulator n=1 Tax=Candidatus Eubacterium faecipullorum TaxID=2838571 RepID=A0A9D1UFA5_9FIRM|nr:TetR/AcrR family transcriptional regulator [Candidatus Eubacterium faecipullorum]